jgi:cytoskeletal protein RodZ
MALTGELSDLSLSELIEFFCNQRKTGRLKVIYPNLPGYFYIQAGALVDARIGSLSGIEAVYYALTLPNASFTFDMELEVEQRTIHQPWTQVVLEGLRRMDEGISPEPPINKEELPDENDLEEAFESVIAHGEQDSFTGPMALTVESMNSGSTKRRMIFGALAIAIISIVAATLVITNRMARDESTALSPPVALQDGVAQNPSNTPDDSSAPQVAETEPSNQSTIGGASAGIDAAAQLREREAREREMRRRAAEERADRAMTDASTVPSTTTPPTAANALKKPDAPKAGPKTVTVQVTYDEAGRVTQASGSDPTALRIARQKRFPSGKPGTTTVTIPIN